MSGPLDMSNYAPPLPSPRIYGRNTAQEMLILYDSLPAAERQRFAAIFVNCILDQSNQIKHATQVLNRVNAQLDALVNKVRETNEVCDLEKIQRDLQDARQERAASKQELEATWSYQFCNGAKQATEWFSPTHSQIEDASSPQKPLPKNVTEQGSKIKKSKQLFIIAMAFIAGYFFRILKTAFFDKIGDYRK